MDKLLFEKMFGISQEFPIVGKLAGWFASASSKIFFAAYVSVGIYLVYKNDSKLLIYLLFPMITLITGYTFRQTIKRARPFVEFSIKPFIEYKRKSFSMPSNHAASAMVVSMACMYFNVPIGIVMLALAVLTGISRIFAGVHYPFDIFAGWIIALIYGSLMLYILL